MPVEAQFADGTVGAFISGPWMIGIVNDAGADPETWTVAHQPTATTGTSFVGGGNLAVFAQADNKTAGWAFVEFASRPEVQVTWYETVQRPAGRAGAWEDEALAGDELLAAFGEQLEDAKSPPAIPTWEQVATAIDGQIEQVAVGDTSPEEACGAMQEEAESIGTGPVSLSPTGRQFHCRKRSPLAASRQQKQLVVALTPPSHASAARGGSG